MPKWRCASPEHRARRGTDWIEREVPLDLLPALVETDGGGPRLVDCLTLWLSNLMHAERDWDHEVTELAAALPGRRAPSFSSPTRSASASCPTTHWRAAFATPQGS